MNLFPFSIDNIFIFNTCYMQFVLYFWDYFAYWVEFGGIGSEALKVNILGWVPPHRSGNFLVSSTGRREANRVSYTTWVLGVEVTIFQSVIPIIFCFTILKADYRWQGCWLWEKGVNLCFVPTTAESQLTTLDWKKIDY